jgi:hypothetical protein
MAMALVSVVGPPRAHRESLRIFCAALSEMVFPDSFADIGVPVSALLGIAFAILLWTRVSSIKVRGASISSGRGDGGRAYLLEEEQRGEQEVRLPRQRLAVVMRRSRHLRLCVLVLHRLDMKRPIPKLLTPPNRRSRRRLRPSKMLSPREPRASYSPSTNTSACSW